MPEPNVNVEPDVQPASVVVDDSNTDVDIEVIDALPVTDEVVDWESASPRGDSCESCGCPVESSDRFCPACGAPNEIFRATQSDDSAPKQKHLRCEGCGSEIASDADHRSYTCPFCDSTIVVEFSPDYSDRQRPEFIIGFAVTPEQAMHKYRTWIQNNKWFRPGDLKRASVADKLQGIYLPFWSFSMLAESTWSASIGEYWYRTETYTTTDANGKTVTRTRRVRETEWWPLQGQHHHYYSGYLVTGSQRIGQAEADQIKPFNMPALKRFESFYLAGWLCEEYSIEKEAALVQSKSEFRRREHHNISNFLPGDTHRQLKSSTRFSQIQSDLCLMPIYLMTYRYRDKQYRFMVNGQTGRIAGKKPVSSAKIGIVIGAAVALFVALLLLILILAGANS